MPKLMDTRHSKAHHLHFLSVPCSSNVGPINSLQGLSGVEPRIQDDLFYTAAKNAINCGNKTTIAGTKLAETYVMRTGMSLTDLQS
jgi:hypothetical protein